MLGTPAPRGTSQTDSTRHVVSSPTSEIANTPTSLRDLENLSTAIPNAEPHRIITNSLWTSATERNKRQRHWQLQLQTVSTPWSVVSGSCSIHWFGQSDMMCQLFAMGRLLEIYRSNRRPFMSARNLEMVSYVMRCIAKAIAKAPYSQIIETYWNTTMQQNNIWSIAFEARTEDILKQICWSNGPHWVLHAQSGTRFEHKLIILNPILLNRQGTPLQGFMISSPSNSTQSIWNSLIRFWQTTSIFLL